jgi:protein-S-isoprenylcysteine O-methyltransferase Ste14
VDARAIVSNARQTGTWSFMRWLEHRIPPPVIAAVIALAMWGLSTLPPVVPVPWVVRLIMSITLALAGVCFDLLGLVAFHRSRTTVNPLRPDKAAVLVTGGVYDVTRNPMYVGMVFLLLAWAAYLASLWALAGPVAFVAYVTRFQIVPEERVLRARLSEYGDYAATVRWRLLPGIW